MSTINPIINLKPTNPTIEEFLQMQSFGLQPYDRSPNDYLRFVAKIFTAWRDPEDNILNFDPFDNEYFVNGGTGVSTDLQATADKSIIAYVDGFQAQYNFVRLVSDANSTNLTAVDTGTLANSGLITYTTETGEIITIDKAKYGEYHRFKIAAGICFIDNQMIQINKETEWWFRVPEVKDYTNGIPNFELGQFIKDPLKVYSLLPNKNYKIILSYQYIQQFESNSARLRFETDDTAIDEPYFLIGSFTTNEFGLIHQTLPVNVSSTQKYKDYVIKEDINASSGQTELLYYLKDINPQYLDKKYMANHKNLFKHLKTQLLTELSNSKISNVFHCKEITEDIDPSVSSGDFVFYDGLQKRWFPAEASRQDFDRVHGLYLRNISEGTNFLFTSGIVEITNDYSIVDSENQVLRNLIPGAEYFLSDDTGTALDTAPFVDAFAITDNRQSGYFSISTSVIAKASSITITFKNSPDSSLPTFSISRTFNLNYKTGEQRIPQEIMWEFTSTELAKVPVIKLAGSGQIQTEKLMFNISLNMVQNDVAETNEEIIENFKLNDDGDIQITAIEYEGLPNETIHNVVIEESNLYIKTNNLSNVLLAKGPFGSPIMKLFDAFGTTAKKDYNALTNNGGTKLKIGEFFNGPTGVSYNLESIRLSIQDIIDDLKPKIYNSDYNNLGLNDTMALLGSEVTKIDTQVLNLKEAIGVLEENYKNAKLLFQSTESDLQQAITLARDAYYISKNNYDKLYSTYQTMVQKRNAMTVKLDEINNEVSSLNTAKAAASATVTDITNIINSIQTIIDTLTSEINSLNSNLIVYNNNIYNLLNNIDTYLDQASNYCDESFNFDLGYYNVNSINMNIDFSDRTKVLQRTLKNARNLHTLYGKVDSSRTNMESLKVIYQTNLDTYTKDLINGVLNVAQQMQALQALSINKTNYDLAYSMYVSNENELSEYIEVRDKLRPEFDKAKDIVRGELFAKVNSNVANNSSWGNSDLYTFTMVLSRPFDFDIRVDFIYKEDTQDLLSIYIPAGNLEASSAVNIQMFPDTNVDAGIPKWVAWNGNTKVDIFNINQFNQTLMDDKAYLLGSSTGRSEPKLFSIDMDLMVQNPVTIDKPSQVNSSDRSKLSEIYVLDNIFDACKNALDSITQRENNVINRDLTLQNITSKTNLKAYNTRYRDALQGQKDTGTTAVNVYDSKIIALEALYTYYKTTNDTIVDVTGTDTSFDKLVASINTVGSLISNASTKMATDKAAYDTSLNNLKIETDKALGEYVDGITEAQELITVKNNTKDRIKVMFDLYEERTKLVISIYDNLNSLLTSGLFNGEWKTTDTFLLNRFEYQDAFENQLIEIVEDLILLPMSSVIIPSVLEYSCGTNGLQYPTDLQPWIFIKTSGKISTKKYPGATSVGIALNENTLIINIQHRPVGDISEFLNVYGNENDFNDQLISKFNTTSNTQIKNNLLVGINNIVSNITDISNVLVKNQTVKTRTVNGKSVTITTSLSETELSLIDTLIQRLTTTGGSTSEATTDINKKEFLIRIIYSKFYGSGQWYNPFEYLFGSVYSPSSWFAAPGNLNLINGKDPFNPEMTKTAPIDTFGEYVQTLYNSINGTALGNVTLNELFKNKLSLYKDLDIIEYILAILPEPFIDYNAKFLTLKSKYQNIIEDTFTLNRYQLKDDPENPNDDFENPNLTDEYIGSAARISSRDTTFSTLISNKTTSKDGYITEIDTLKINHDDITKRIGKYNFYKTFLNSLKEDIKVAIRFYETKLSNLEGLKLEFNLKLKFLNSEYLTYNNKLNKLPNVMWDIFRITNFQRTKWNYTYLALRIMGMQKELNNIISGNNIQYSPINSELAELGILYNKALTNGEEATAYAYKTQINSIEQKKTNFTTLLKNMVSEFNVIQLKYNKPTITSETQLISSYLIPELYMQDPTEYNLSYEFSPYPAYKELV